MKGWHDLNMERDGPPTSWRLGPPSPGAAPVDGDRDAHAHPTNARHRGTQTRISPPNHPTRRLVNPPTRGATHCTGARGLPSQTGARPGLGARCSHSPTNPSTQQGGTPAPNNLNASRRNSGEYGGHVLAILQLAAELGWTEQTLRNWLRQDEAGRGVRSDMLSSEDRKRVNSDSTSTASHPICQRMNDSAD
jgi:hypothetical protein